MESSKLDQLKIEREPEKPGGSMRWPLIAVLVLALIAAAAWWFFKPEAAIEVRTAVAREITNKAASTVLNASGHPRGSSAGGPGPERTIRK